MEIKKKTNKNNCSHHKKKRNIKIKRHMRNEKCSRIDIEKICKNIPKRIKIINKLN